MRGGGSSGGTSGSGCRDRILLESSLLGISRGICCIKETNDRELERLHVKPKTSGRCSGLMKWALCDIAKCSKDVFAVLSHTCVDPNNHNLNHARDV